MPAKASAILIATFLFTVFVLVGRTTSAPNPAPTHTATVVATEIAVTPESTLEATEGATAEATESVTETALVGDPVRGKDLFENGANNAPPCKSCHTITSGHVMFALAPNLKGIAERAATRVPGMSAAQYIEDSIRNPADYLVSTFRPIMYPYFAKDYNDQDIADLVAFLMTQ
jgi:cytochrome c